MGTYSWAFVSESEARTFCRGMQNAGLRGVQAVCAQGGTTEIICCLREALLKRQYLCVVAGAPALPWPLHV